MPIKTIIGVLITILSNNICFANMIRCSIEQDQLPSGQKGSFNGHSYATIKEIKLPIPDCLVKKGDILQLKVFTKGIYSTGNHSSISILPSGNRVTSVENNMDQDYRVLRVHSSELDKSDYQPKKSGISTYRIEMYIIPKDISEEKLARMKTPTDHLYLIEFNYDANHVR